MINKYVAKRERRKIIVIMRGYRKLKAQGKLHDVNKLKDFLAEEEFEKIEFRASKKLFGASFESSVLVVRQYLYTRIFLNLGFNKAILYSVGSGKPVSHPLPKEWREQIEQQGYSIDHFSSCLKWVLFLFKHFCYGLYRSLVVLNYALINIFSHKHHFNSSFSYFHNLSTSNLPHGVNSKDSENIISWYAQWSGRNQNVTEFHHNVKGDGEHNVLDSNIHYVPLNQLNIRSIKSFFLFVRWLCISMTICIKDLFTLRWWTFLLFEQFVQAAAFRYAKDKDIAKDYLMHNSSWVYRPIWSYEAEAKGARLIFYFYSTNCEVFKQKNGYIKTTNGWELSSWPFVLVWDQYQQEFVQKFSHSCRKIEVVGQIWFSDLNYECKLDFNFDSRKVAAIFDVQPHRASRYQTLGLPTEYFDSKVAIQFLDDIFQVLNENNVIILHKQKRRIGNILHPKYRKALVRLASHNLISIDPSSSANKLIGQVDFVISMPFTSTALSGCFQNKPSIFYDPYGDVQLDDLAAHGIPIIIGIDELRRWVTSIL